MNMDGITISIIGGALIIASNFLYSESEGKNKFSWLYYIGIGLIIIGLLQFNLN